MRREKSIRLQGQDRLRQMFAKGRGTKKYDDMQKNGRKPAADKIYDHVTLQTYLQGWNNFCDYLNAQGINGRDLNILEPYVQPFVDWLVKKKYSASTIHTWLSAVSKVLELSLSNYQCPKRERADIKRSRYPVKSDAHFAAANHQDLIDFCRSVGPRNHKELVFIRGTDLVHMKDGRYAVNIRQGKGGKPRFAPIYGPPERVARVVELMEAAKGNLLFKKIPVAADIHSYRAEYACTIYAAHARPLGEIPREDRYICRKDKAGVVYDRAAMLIASRALGHNRVDVIANSYLWALDS